MLVPYNNFFYPEKPFVIVFNHIPKCGGSTFNIILNNQFRRKNLIVYKCPTYIDFLNLKYLKERSNYNFLIYGHFVWGIEKYFNWINNKKIYYLTILREPWNIFLSMYHFRYKKGYFRYNIEEFFNKEYSHNFLINWLGNGDINTAKKNLIKRHFLFGLVEQYDDFLKMFCYFFKINSLTYKIFNKTNKQKKYMDKKHILKIKYKFIEKNKLDYEFYQYAEKIFNKRLEELNLKKIKIKKEFDVKFVEEDKDISKIFIINKDSLEEKEKALIEYVKNVYPDVFLLIRFYKENHLYKKLYLLCEEILKNIYNNFKINYNCNFLDSSCLCKFLTNIIEIKNTLKYNFKKISYNNFFDDLIPCNWINFCRQNNYSKVGFYGISGRFFSYYREIKKYFLNTNKKVFLFDTDKNKWKIKISSLIINSPDFIKKVKPEVIIITSHFWKEINNFLMKIKKENNLSFKIKYLSDYFTIHPLS